MIPVTKSFLPPRQEYDAQLTRAWESGWLTNNGSLLLELEARLREYLGVKHVFVVNNGTIALQIAFRALEIRGPVVTTPFSYVATTSTLVWEGCEPVFADIDPHSFCISPSTVGLRCTSDTAAILATHVYGNACDVAALSAIANERSIPVIYDAAHAFGVRLNGKSLLTYGDVSTLSFHSTKLFHTVEGGAVVTADDTLAHRIAYLRNFGHDGPEAFHGLGINGKQSEFHAAMGLAVLPYVQSLIESRRAVSELYDRELDGLPLSRPTLADGLTYNYAYYPVLLPDEASVIAVRDGLAENGVLVRRYFFPSLTQLPYVSQQHCPVAEEYSRRVLCLPLYHDLPSGDVIRIAGLVRSLVSAYA